MPSGVYKKTKPPWNKGKNGYHLKPLSEESKRKISKGHKGKHHSKEIREKLSESHKSEKSYMWKGGITPENEKARHNVEFRLWREAVFARDNWICQKCGERGGKLHPHHIFNFATYLDLRFAIDNGITLCEKCHRKFHKKYGKNNNTKEQLEEFLKVVN